MVYYEAWLKLTPDPEQGIGPFKSSDPFDADTPADRGSCRLQIDGDRSKREWKPRRAP